MPWSSNGTFLVEVARPARTATASRCGPSTSPSGASGRCGTSRPGSGQREIAACGARRRARLGPRARSRSGATTRRSASARSSGSSTPTSSSTTSRCSRTRRNHPQLAAHVRLRPASSTTPTARAGTACVDADGHIWGIDNGLSFARRVQAAHRHLGLRRRARSPTTLLDDRRRPPRPRPARRAGRAARPVRARRHHAPGPAPSCARGCFPTDPSGRRFPWPLV